MDNDFLKLTRDTEVVQIPEGYKVRLARGTQVRVMQSLGDTFTLMTEYHTLVRLEGKDAEAIGKTPPETKTAAPVSPTAAAETPDGVKQHVWEALRDVFDPEIPVNVVELGLVYKNDVSRRDDGTYHVDVDMTLTAPGCGMGNVLKEDAERRIHAIPGVQTVNVQMVVDPPWDSSKMSDAAKLELGLA